MRPVRVGVAVVVLAGLAIACPASKAPPTSDQGPPPTPPPQNVEPAGPPVITAAVETPEATAAHAAAQQRMQGAQLTPDPRVHFTPVENPPGKLALRYVHEQLRALASGQRPGKLRIAVYGASSTAADRYTGYLRAYLQHRFGDGGTGFVTAVPLWRWHRHNEAKAAASKHWAIEHAQKKKGRLDGHYGLIGASAYTTHKRATATVVPRKDATSRAAARIELFYLAQPGGGSMALTIGGDTSTVSTAAEAIGAGYVERDVALDPYRVELRPRGDGEVRLFGVVVENDETGLVLDELGIGGTRAANHVDWNEAIWADNIRRRDPALYVLAYGANESIDEDEPIEVYADNLDAVLQRFARAVPKASCLLIGPVDFPIKVEEPGEEVRWDPRPRIEQIIGIQRKTAAARGCGFFDARAMTGGPASMDSWVVTEPPLAKKDHLHFTTLGYHHMGRVLADAIMAEYDRDAVR